MYLSSPLSPLSRLSRISRRFWNLPFSGLEVGGTYLLNSLNELSSTGSIYHSCLFVKYISQNIRRPVSDIAIFYKLSTDYYLYLSQVYDNISNMENTPTFEQHLVQAGLSGEQARLYESLVRNGPSPASDAARMAKVSRTLAYKVFAELTVLGLVEKRENAGKVALFTAAHPLKLKELIERREQEAKDALTALEGVLGQMTSEYNIAGGRPGVQFYEGMDGVRRVLEDSLTSKTDILQYADVEVIETRLKKINEDYLNARAKRDIAKKLIVIDSDFTRRLYATIAEEAKSEVRAIPKGDAPFDVALMIYDGKISYLTLRAETPIGVIIADQSIYEMHRHLFLTLYAQAKPIQIPHSVDDSVDQQTSV